MSHKLETSAAACTRPAVGYPGVGGGGAGQLGHEDAVDVSGKDQDTEKLERNAAPSFSSSATSLQTSHTGREWD